MQAQQELSLSSFEAGVEEQSLAARPLLRRGSYFFAVSVEYPHAGIRVFNGKASFLPDRSVSCANI